jgi:hypothetical protein
VAVGAVAAAVAAVVVVVPEVAVGPLLKLLVPEAVVAHMLIYINKYFHALEKVVHHLKLI